MRLASKGRRIGHTWRGRAGGLHLRWNKGKGKEEEAERKKRSIPAPQCPRKKRVRKRFLTNRVTISIKTKTQPARQQS